MSGPLYLVHGLLGTAYGHFEPQIRAWRREFDVVPVDLPGHGRCPVDATDDFAAGVARFLLAVCERFGRGRVVAASYLSGPAAVRVAERRPDLVESLVLTGFVPGLAEEVFVPWVDGFERLPADDPDVAERYEQLHGPRWRRTLAAFATQARTRYADTAIEAARIGALQVPVLLVNGGLKTVERAAALAAPRLGPHVAGAVVPGAGHLPGLDDPAAFETAVRGFWASPGAPAVPAVPAGRGAR